MFAHPDQVDAFRFVPGHFCICKGCGLIRRLPVATRDDMTDYGKSYYDQMTKSKASQNSIITHANLQKLHYETMRVELLKRFPASEYPRWLDVGSAGPPTAFTDYEFTTIEPDPLAVEIGRELFSRDRILCGILEDYKPERNFDGLVFMNSLYCTPTPALALAAAHATLRDGGILMIAICGKIMDAIDNGVDGHTMCIEDMLRGDTLFNYFNQSNLEILCARHGFKMIESVPVLFPEIAPFHELRFMFFRRSDAVSFRLDAADLIEKSRQKTAIVLKTLVAGFETATRTTIEMIDRTDTAIITTMDLLVELFRVRPLTKAKLLVDVEQSTPSVGFSINGAHLSGIADLVRDIGAGQTRHVVIINFNGRMDIAAMLMRQFGAGALNYYAPSRTSGINRIFSEFDGSLQMIKGLELNRLELTAGNLIRNPTVVCALRDNNLD
ncbi:MAG: hypothetical protein A3G18_02590 [Rhodospirillales bacterium RIFCSPLOWO2_12_FULL_58_28]|nr:MAG: hypothetical protein A3H92_06650 [Rhodospirillales bacterium RIFCSPLOWO2_02_FULL_58_16]OHC78939.1 MAG: hypothetical protein A3G18_02590 [Rhodospirillales bacterium RIFCSPLOWO2_12_FULL_58_28]